MIDEDHPLFGCLAIMLLGPLCLAVIWYVIVHIIFWILGFLLICAVGYLAFTVYDEYQKDQEQKREQAEQWVEAQTAESERYHEAWLQLYELYLANKRKIREILGQ